MYAHMREPETNSIKFRDKSVSRVYLMHFEAASAHAHVRAEIVLRDKRVHTTSFRRKK